MYEEDGDTAIRPVLIHPHGAELGRHIVHDIGLWTQCTQIFILGQIAAACVRALEPTVCRTQRNPSLLRETDTGHARSGVSGAVNHCSHLCSFVIWVGCAAPLVPRILHLRRSPSRCSAALNIVYQCFTAGPLHDVLGADGIDQLASEATVQLRSALSRYPAMGTCRPCSSSSPQPARHSAPSGSEVRSVRGGQQSNDYAIRPVAG